MRRIGTLHCLLAFGAVMLGLLVPPMANADDIRRRSSSIRSSVRATSKPPDWVKTPISWYCRTESIVRSVISREWSTGKMKLDA